MYMRINIILPIEHKEFMSFTPNNYDKTPKTFINYITERLVNLGKLQLDLGEDDLVNFLSGRKETAIVNVWSDDNQKLFTVTAKLQEPPKDFKSFKRNKKPVIEFVQCPGKKDKKGNLLGNICRKFFL